MMRRVVVFLVFTLSPCFVYAREQHVLRAGSVDPNPTTSCEYWDDEGVERDDGVCTPNKHCQPPTRAVYFGCTEPLVCCKPETEEPEMTTVDCTKQINILNWWPPCDGCFKTFTRLLNLYTQYCVTIHFCNRGTTAGNKKCTAEDGYEGWDSYTDMEETFPRFKIAEYTGPNCAMFKAELKEHKKKGPHVSCLLGPANNCVGELVFNSGGQHSETIILKKYLRDDGGTNEDTCYPGSLKPVFV